MPVTILLVLLMCFAGLKAIDYTSSRIVAPVVLNSLPPTKVQCDDSALPGHCTKWNISIKEYEAMQK